jgi:hypothetical protein
MLSNIDLAAEFEELSRLAGELGAHVRDNFDLPAWQLAAGLVEGGKIGERLAKLDKQLRGVDGRKRK